MPPLNRAEQAYWMDDFPTFSTEWPFTLWKRNIMQRKPRWTFIIKGNLHYQLNFIQVYVTFWISSKSFKGTVMQCNNKYMIASTQITNTEIFAFTTVLVNKLLCRKVLLIVGNNNRLLKSSLLLKKIANFTGKLLQNYK